MPAPDEDRLDSLAYTLGRYDAEVAPARSFQGRGVAAEDADAWRRDAREAFRSLLGPMPPEVVPRAERPGEPVARPGFTRTPIVFRTRPDLDACGYLLVPEGAEAGARRPGVLCLPGHGRGVDDIVGIGPDGRDRDVPAGYQADFAVQAVKQGYVVLALEMLGFGRRRDAAARTRGPEECSCQPAAGAALLLGETMLGWRTWDAMRALDLLAEHPAVDPARLALIGISGGGTVGLATAALDERVAIAVLSGSFCTLRDSIYGVSHCLDNYVPGLLTQFEAADLAGLVAPRCLFVEGGKQDPLFPIAGVRKAIGGAAAIYRTMDCPDRLGAELFDGDHRFHGVGAFARLAAWLAS